MIYSSFVISKLSKKLVKSLSKLPILSRNGTYNKRLDRLKMYKFAAFGNSLVPLIKSCRYSFFHSKSSVNVRVVNQLLTEMDGLEARKQVFIMGATNRPGR